jgi:M6 family metalloprotease-like protein
MKLLIMKKIKILLFSVLLLAINHSAFGVIAYPYPVEITQQDGSKITIILRGDEHVKWAETTDGYSILRNSNGIYEYAILNPDGDMVPSGILVKNQSERSSSDIQYLIKIGKGITFSESQTGLMRSISDIYDKNKEKVFPTKGSRKLVCILMGFTDKAFTKTKADLESLFNQVGYNTDGATGSVYDFYKENSFNQLDLTVTVAGPYMAANNMAYYGANDTYGNDLRPRELITEAVYLADPAVNYADFDNDNDGTVDGVYVIYAGYGEEYSGVSTSAIWAHAWSINPVTLDGKIISRYSCSSELRGSSGTGLTRIGVICHEFGHVMGAYDFYDTNGTTNGSYTGTGNWDMMAGGSWNNSGATPAHHNPYTKIYSFGWATATTLVSQTSINITLSDAAQNSNSFYRVNTAKLNEYFLIENRQQLKFDTYIPGHGMVIYHVDGDYISKAGNQINAGSHQGMYAVCANATGNPPTIYGTINSGGLPFPGTGLRTSFTDNTTPYSRCWVGANTNKPITNITEDITAKTVSFSFIVNKTAPSAITVAASGVLPTSATINGLVSASNTTTTVTFEYGTTTGYGSTVNGNPATVTGESLTEITAVLPGLSEGTTYNYRVKAVSSFGTTYGSNMTFTTLETPRPYNLHASIADPDLGVVNLTWKYDRPVYEDFEDGAAQNFVFYDNRTFVENGTLTAYGLGNNTWAETYYNNNYQNFILEYKVKRNQGDQAASIGTLFRSSGLRNTSNLSGYAFYLASSGGYSVFKLTSNVATSLIPWTSSSAINTGNDAWNIITIEAIGSTIKFYINSQYINSITDATYTSGRFNFTSYFDSGYTHKICWDDISIFPQSGIMLNTPVLVTAINTPLNVDGSPEKAPEILSNNKPVTVKGIIDEAGAPKMTFRYFKVYRNGGLLDTTSLTNYTNFLQNYGNYKYKVSAIYNEGESKPSSPDSIGWYGNPIISVNPASFNETLLAGDSISRNMTIKNNGSGLLIFNIPKIIDGSNIFEDFEDGVADNFVINDNRIFVANGMLNAYGSGNNTWAETFYNKDFRDFTLEFKTKRNLGDPSAAISMVFRSTGLRSTSDLNGYAFHITSNGSYSVWKYTSNVTTAMIPWTSSSAINSTIDMWNIVTIEATGSIVKFYINGQYVNSISDATYTTGRFVFGSYFSTGYTHRILWDDISIIPKAGLLKSTSSMITASNTLLDINSSPEQSPENLSKKQAVEVRGLVEKLNTWISSSLATDTIPAGDSLTIQVKFSAKSLNAGDYTTNLLINSTDWNNPQIKVPCALHVIGKPNAEFTSNTTQGFAGDKIQFTDMSAGDPTSWQWIFPSGIPATSSERNPKVAYGAIGTYNVTLIAINGYGKDTITKVAYISVKSMQYCTSTLGGSGICPGDITALAIYGTALNNINHYLCSTANYSTYASYPATGSTTGSVEKGFTYQFSVTTSVSDIVSVWIDYNHNSIFETTEWTQLSTMTTANVASIKSITIPQTALDGKTTMRIRSRAYGYTNGAANACTYFTTGGGITEDYIISIGVTQPPTLYTAAVSAITLTTAVSGGNIISDGNDMVIEKGVCWSTAINPTVALTTKTSDGTGLGTFSSNITGLTPGVTYHVRAYATNGTGTSYGADIPFTTCTTAVIPSVTTNSPSSIMMTSATSGGIITSGGCAEILAKGICWSTTLNPTIDLTTKTTDGTGSGAFTSSISGLSPGITYHVRAYAVNSAGTAYGSDVQFTTCSAVVIPTVTTTAVYSIELASATSGGIVTSGGCAPVTSRGICWSTVVNPTLALSTKTIDGTGEGVFTSNMSGLNGGTTYHIRAYATNSSGTGYGADIAFTTPLHAPFAYSASKILQTGFTANWGSSLNATGYNLDVATNSLFTTFVPGYNNKDIGNLTSATVTGLITNTTYYYRVRAYGTGGTSANSNMITTATLEYPPPAPIVNVATNILQTSFTANWSSSSTTTTGYQLDVSANSAFTTFISGYNSKDIGNILSISITGLNANTSYYYRIRAYNSGGNSPNSGSILTTTLPFPPSAPVANTATNIVQTSFTARWSSSATATGYKLDVSTNNTFTALLSGYNNKDVGNQLTTSVTGLTAKTTYYYRVRSYNAGGESNNLNLIAVTTLTIPPTTPAGFSSSSCNNLVTLTWTRSTDPNVYQYRIYAGTTSNSLSKIDSIAVGTSDNTKIFRDLRRKQTYYFRITAVNYDGPESPLSTQSVVTVKTGVIPKIKVKWGEVLICSNLGDSISVYKWYNGSSLISSATNQYYVTKKLPGVYNVTITDKDGCVNSSNNISISGSKSLSAYPNPASVSFALKLNDVPEGSAIISVLTLTGIKVMEFEVENVTDELLKEIPVNNLNEGVYVVQILVDNKDLFYTKIIVKK